jgi:hypothetical protein
MALCMASYHVMVRHTFLGVWLHGRRERAGAKSRYQVHMPASLSPSPSYEK